MLLIITDDFKKDDIKKENGEVDDVDHDYIGDEYKDLQRWIDDYLKSTLSDRDLHLTEFYSRKFTLIKIVNNYLEKNIDVDDILFSFEKSIKNLSDVDSRIYRIIDYYKPTTETKYDDEKVFSVFNAVKNSNLDFCLNRETIFKLTEKYQPQRLDKVINYSER